MTRINIVVEGQTERQFVEGPLLEHLLPFGILVSGKIIGVPGHKGGRVNYARVKKDVTHLLRSDRRSHCSTLIDYYGLGDGFPGDASRQEKTLRQQHAAGIERATLDDIAEALGDDLRVRERFVPFIVLHEFEALLFSDPKALAESIGEPSLAQQFQIIVAAAGAPEDIDDSPQTAPSKRILGIFPRYRKALDGPRAVEAIGVPTIVRACPHFAEWLERLQVLASSRP